MHARVVLIVLIGFIVAYTNGKDFFAEYSRSGRHRAKNESFITMTAYSGLLL